MEAREPYRAFCSFCSFLIAAASCHTTWLLIQKTLIVFMPVRSRKYHQVDNVREFSKAAFLKPSNIYVKKYVLRKKCCLLSLALLYGNWHTGLIS